MAGKLHTSKKAAGIALAGLMFLAACGSGVDDSGLKDDDQSSDDGPKASFDGTADGDTVSNPVVVTAKASGIEIAAAADEIEGAGHFHVMIDTDCVAEGEAIPKDDNHRHFGDGSTELDLGDIDAGEHTLCLQIGDNTHIATGATDEITITVAASASFTGIEDGDTVSSPLVVNAEASGIEIAAAADEIEGAGHFHVMIDTDCVTEGEAIPKDDNHRHFGDGSTELDLGDIDAGEHTLCLQIGDNTHVATGATHEITITVAG